METSIYTTPLFPAHEALKGVDLFTALDDREILRLASATRVKSCLRGETLVIENEKGGDHLYVVAEGEVAVTLDGGDGKETILALLKRGDFFGDMSLLDGAPHSASVRATQPSKLVSLRREDFQRLLRDNTDLSWSLLCELTRRLRQSNRKVACLAHQRVERRIASAIWQLFEERGVRLKDENGRRSLILRHRPTQQHIAEMAGTSRETVSRMLTAWEKRGVLREENHDLFLLEEKALRFMAGEMEAA